MDLQAIRKQLKQRQHQRQMQAAMYGINADPSISIETEKLTDAIQALDDWIQIKGIEASKEFKDDARTHAVTQLRNVGVFTTERDL